MGVIAIASGKGGVGKSTLTAHTGLFMAAQGKSVCVVDMDMGLRSQDILLGLENKVVFDLADVAEGMCRMKQALVHHETYENLCLLSAAQARGSEGVSALQMKKILSTLKEKFDLVLVDCPAGIGRGFKSGLYACDKAVVVSVPGAVELRDAERVVQLIRRMDLPDPALVLNRVHYRHMEDEEGGVPAYARRLEGIRLAGLVPDEVPFGSEGPAQRALNIAAQNITGGEIIPLPIRRPGLFKRLSQAIRG